MHKTYSTFKVVRTWFLLLSLPLYIGATSVWMKEEIKVVLGSKEKVQIVASSMEEQIRKSFEQKALKDQTVFLP